MFKDKQEILQAIKLKKREKEKNEVRDRKTNKRSGEYGWCLHKIKGMLNTYRKKTKHTS
jgi:hypothetical protein